MLLIAFTVLPAPPARRGRYSGRSRAGWGARVQHGGSPPTMTRAWPRAPRSRRRSRATRGSGRRAPWPAARSCAASTAARCSGRPGRPGHGPLDEAAGLEIRASTSGDAGRHVSTTSQRSTTRRARPRPSARMREVLHGPAVLVEYRHRDTDFKDIARHGIAHVAHTDESYGRGHLSPPMCQRRSAVSEHMPRPRPVACRLLLASHHPAHERAVLRLTSRRSIAV